jgi:hypothetical protein
MFLLGLAVVTPMADMLFPGLGTILMYFFIYPCGVGSLILEVGLFIGILALIVRILVFKERLRVA